MFRITRTDETTIGEGALFDGTLRMAHPLTVHGTLKGKIESESTVTIGPAGRIEGEIEAKGVTVNGRALGVITCEGDLRIGPKGLVDGEVHYRTLQVERGGAIHGRSVQLGAGPSWSQSRELAPDVFDRSDSVPPKRPLSAIPYAPDAEREALEDEVEPPAFADAPEAGEDLEAQPSPALTAEAAGGGHGGVLVQPRAPLPGAIRSASKTLPPTGLLRPGESRGGLVSEKKDPTLTGLGTSGSSARGGSANLKVVKKGE